MSAFAKFGREVFELEGLDVDVAQKSVEALAEFIKAMGLPTTFKEMEITDRKILRAVADTCNIMPGCAKQMSRDEIYEILLECL